MSDNYKYCPNCGGALTSGSVRVIDDKDMPAPRTNKTGAFNKIFKTMTWIVMATLILFGILCIYDYYHIDDYYKVNSDWTRDMYVLKGKPFRYSNLARYPDNNKGNYTYFPTKYFRLFRMIAIS